MYKLGLLIAILFDIYMIGLLITELRDHLPPSIPKNIKWFNLNWTNE